MTNVVLSSINIDELVDRVASEVHGRLLNIYNIPAPVDNEYLTREETAKRLGLSLPTLNEYSKSGVIPSYRLGSRVRYKSNEVEAALLKVQSVKGKRV